jgi:YXWGXW repeat-containing protein
MRTLFRGLIGALSLAALPLAAPAAALVGVSVNIAPPVLPVYVQPAIPAPGYLWTPGYWSWAPTGYYWVPGTWVMPPALGLLWTPGYWGWGNGAYLWHGGYWGPHVGFYGGVNYGYGYGGAGYEGGYWRGNQFLYNSTVNNVRTINVTNVYSRTVVNNTTITRVSYNGGAGGIAARPSQAELSAAHEQHVAITSEQRAHESMARGDESLRAAVNGGRPPVAATARAASFTGRDVVAARGAVSAAHPAGVRPSNPPTAYAAHPQGGAPGGVVAERPSAPTYATHPAGGTAPAYRNPAAPAGHPQGEVREPQAHAAGPGGHEGQGRR